MEIGPSFPFFFLLGSPTGVWKGLELFLPFFFSFLSFLIRLPYAISTSSRGSIRDSPPLFFFSSSSPLPFFWPAFFLPSSTHTFRFRGSLKRILSYLSLFLPPSFFFFFPLPPPPPPPGVGARRRQRQAKGVGKTIPWMVGLLFFPFFFFFFLFSLLSARGSTSSKHVIFQSANALFLSFSSLFPPRRQTCGPVGTILFPFFFLFLLSREKERGKSSLFSPFPLFSNFFLLYTRGSGPAKINRERLFCQLSERM